MLGKEAHVGLAEYDWYCYCCLFVRCFCAKTTDGGSLFKSLLVCAQPAESGAVERAGIWIFVCLIQWDALRPVLLD